MPLPNRGRAIGPTGPEGRHAPSNCAPQPETSQSEWMQYPARLVVVRAQSVQMHRNTYTLKRHVFDNTPILHQAPPPWSNNWLVRRRNGPTTVMTTNHQRVESCTTGFGTLALGSAALAMRSSVSQIASFSPTLFQTLVFALVDTNPCVVPKCILKKHRHCTCAFMREDDVDVV